MDDLLRQVVNSLNTVQDSAHDLHFLATMDRALAEACKWDEPKLDEIILTGIEPCRRRAEDED